MKTKKKLETILHTRTVLNGKDIIALLSRIPKLKITKETKVIFNVPSGGDYSGMQIEIDDENPIIVTSKSYDLKVMLRSPLAKNK